MSTKKREMMKAALRHHDASSAPWNLHDNIGHTYKKGGACNGMAHFDESPGFCGCL